MRLDTAISTMKKGMREMKIDSEGYVGETWYGEFQFQCPECANINWIEMDRSKDNLFFWVCPACGFKAKVTCEVHVENA